MRFVFYMNIVSPHQLPLARALADRVGSDNLRYVFVEKFHAERASMGWSDSTSTAPFVVGNAESNENIEWVENADVLLSGIRDFDLFERRCQRCLRTFYTSERWFKPPIGMLRLLHPRYWKMARRMRQLALKNSQVFTYLPIGVHAAADMARVFDLLGGNLNCLLRAPLINFENFPTGRIDRYPWMKMWGYFVSPSTHSVSLNTQHTTQNNLLRVLWVGRMLWLKHVETIIRAVVRANLRSGGLRYTLTIVGNGDMEAALKGLTRRLLNENHLDNTLITFGPSVPILQVRELMRAHDLYAFSSNGYDGWGAVVSEALEEGMLVVGSKEAGASATILPNGCQFKCRDWIRLSELLLEVGSNEMCRTGIGQWTAESAATNMVKAI